MRTKGEGRREQCAGGFTFNKGAEPFDRAKSASRLRASPFALRSPRPRRGFTLIEAVVALALFVLCAGILLQTLASARLALFGNLRRASGDADRRLAVRTILASPDLRTLARDGKLTSPEGDVLRWHCEAKPTDTIDLHRVTARLVRESKDGEVVEDTTLTLYALRPAWSDPVEREALLARKKSAAPQRGPKH